MTPWTCTARALATALLLSTRPLPAQVQPRKPTPAPPPKPGTLVITAALVDRDMQVRAVPLHALLLIGTGSDTLAIRTGTDGRASLSMPPGPYTLISVAPSAFQGQRYRWKLGLTIRAGTASAVALTNDNAVVEEGPKAPVLTASE